MGQVTILSRAPGWDDEVLCDHRSAGGRAVTHVRGTLLVSSLQVLKEAGRYERYLRELPEQWHEPVLFAIALSWVPVEVAIAHYAACDALALSDRELGTIGELVAGRLAETFLGSILQAARGAGVDAPWIALRAQPRIWDRIYQGGGVKVWRTGPKDAKAEFYGLPLTQFHYFRIAYCGYYRGLANLFVRSAYVKATRAEEPKPDTFAIAASWV